jgi:Domain of unknown function (DUF397)
MSIYSAVPGNVAWRISSKCDGGTCVGVARLDEFVVVGNTAHPEGPIYKFTREEWGAFLRGVKFTNFGGFY